MTPEQFFRLTWHTWNAVIFDGLFFGMVVGAVLSWLDRDVPEKAKPERRWIR